MILWLKTLPKRVFHALTIPTLAVVVMVFIILFEDSKEVESAQWNFFNDLFSDVFR